MPTTRRAWEEIQRRAAQPAPGPGQLACLDCRLPVAAPAGDLSVTCPACGTRHYVTADGSALGRWPSWPRPTT